MKPAPFEYHAPETVDEVCALLAEYGDEAKVLAGGQSLVPMLALRLTRFEHLVDLNRVAELVGLRARERDARRAGRERASGCMERDPRSPAAVPLLARATPLIGHFQIRNRGTVGGSLAHADPASEYPAVAVALGAELELAGPRRHAPSGRGRRLLRRHVDDRGRARRAVSSRRASRCGRQRSGFAIEEVARRHGDFALAGVACAVDCRAGAGIALFGVGSTPVRARRRRGGAASPARRRPMSPRPQSAELDPPADVHASSSTRTAHRPPSRRTRGHPRPGGSTCCRLR